MSILWSVTSFVYYLMQIFNKYLEGTVLTNFLYDSIAGIFAMVVSSLVYNRLPVRLAFAVCFGMALVCGLAIFGLEAKEVQLSDGKPGRLEVTLIPALAFLLKIGNTSAFSVAYMASFGSETLFPS